MDDNQLIDQSLSGNREAFGILVRKYQDRLHHTLAHVVGSIDDAADIAQDVFVQAFIKLRSFERKASFYTWLYRIAVNMSVSHQRRKKPTLSIDQLRETSPVEPLDPGDAPDERLNQQHRVECVRAALANLPIEFRQVLVLREMEDCDYDTIADLLDLPLGTVRSRLHRARLQMRDQLKGVLQEE